MAIGDTVDGLQKRISSQEFTDWQAYFLIEPYGYPVEEWRWGSMIAHICNAVRSTVPAKGSIKIFKASDFYPTKKKTDDLTPEQREHLERKRKKKRG